MKKDTGEKRMHKFKEMLESLKNIEGSYNTTYRQVLEYLSIILDGTEEAKLIGPLLGEAVEETTDGTQRSRG